MALHWTGRWCVSLPSRTLHPKDIAGRRGPFQRGLICRGASGRIGVGRSTCWQPRAARGWLCHLCHLCCLCYLGTRAAKAWTAAPHLSVANLWGSMWSANRNKLQNTLSRRRRNSSLQHSWRGTLSDDSGCSHMGHGHMSHVLSQRCMGFGTHLSFKCSSACCPRHSDANICLCLGN